MAKEQPFDRQGGSSGSRITIPRDSDANLTDELPLSQTGEPSTARLGHVGSASFHIRNDFDTLMTHPNGQWIGTGTPSSTHYKQIYFSCYTYIPLLNICASFPPGQLKTSGYYDE